MNASFSWDDIFDEHYNRKNEYKTDGLKDLMTSMDGESCHSDKICKEKAFTPLDRLPADIRENVTNAFYEQGMYSGLEKFLRDELIYQSNELQRLMNSLYRYAIRKHSHILAFNVIVVLSQLPYENLGSWADILALAATRSSYMDVAEMGIRCFENWENITSIEFLDGCYFSEKWLQEYTDQVCDYVKENGANIDVLFAQNNSWEMAQRERSSASNTEGYSSRYSTGRIENR